MTRWTIAEVKAKYQQSLFINNKAYDISEFHLVHPGGDVILAHVGKDCSGKSALLFP
jgi:cytochrome b involved in lipid metabolism